MLPLLISIQDAQFFLLSWTVSLLLDSFNIKVHQYNQKDGVAYG